MQSCAGSSIGRLVRLGLSWDVQLQGIKYLLSVRNVSDLILKLGGKGRQLTNSVTTDLRSLARLKTSPTQGAEAWTFAQEQPENKILLGVLCHKFTEIRIVK